MVHFDPLVKKMSDANHLSWPLRKRKFTSTSSKGRCLWFVIGGFRSVWWVSVFQGSLLVILLWPKPDVNIPNIYFFSSLDFRLPNNDEEKILKIQINFWDRKGAIKCRASRAFFPTCLLPCTRSSHGGHSPRLACLLGLFTCLARIAYCTFASKQAVSITLFGPLPNNEEEEG